MKIKILIVILILILIILAFGYSRFIFFNPLKIAPSEKSDSLKYKVFWGLIPVGKVEIRVDENAIYNGEKVTLLKAQAKTTGIIAMIFNFRADIYSVIDKKNKLPILYSENIFREGKVKEKKILRYDQKKHILKVEGKIYSILPRTYDPLSAILFLKDRNLKVGKKYELNVNSNQSNYKVIFEVKDEIVTGDKKILVLKGLSERRRGQKARHRLAFTVYIAPEQNLPILIRTFTNTGPVSIRLCN